ncbi:hypothetical protein BGX21_005669 [Mortierella sp. AD011]|nr:hypothetical protein BGX21_005669 [Mortierella sp. AD011]
MTLKSKNSTLREPFAGEEAATPPRVDALNIRNLLKLVQIFKYGITTVSEAAPALSNLKLVEGVEAIKGKIDTTTKTIGNLMDEIKAVNIDIKSGGAELDKIEALEGVVNGIARVLGNLYRTVALGGHVKWVCLSH